MQCRGGGRFHQQRSLLGVDCLAEPYGAEAADWEGQQAGGEAQESSQRGPDFPGRRWYRARFVMPHFVCGRMGVILLVQLGRNAAGAAD